MNFLFVLVLLAGSTGAPVQGSPLLVAARSGRVEVVRELLQSGVDPNGADARGSTALMEAAGAGNMALVQLLLASGAEKDARDRLGLTALDRALRAGRKDVVELLVAHGALGSGKSPGDLVCVKRWAAEGYCGRIEGLESGRYRLRIERLDGCVAGCAADRDCFPGDAPLDSRALGLSVLVPASCFTRTYPGSAARP